MKVAELLEGVSVERIIGDKNTEIRQLYCDSGAVEAGGLYFALKGSKADGHDYCGFA
jgi:UDP-N-acetylmuramoyl-L-alanyl-D-glutamate--2,6-diaminopimelate ligase